MTTYMKMFRCPECHGQGGGYDPVLFCGIGGGPWEECCLCNGAGRVRILRMLLWQKWQLEHWIRKNTVALRRTDDHLL